MKAIKLRQPEQCCLPPDTAVPAHNSQVLDKLECVCHSYRHMLASGRLLACRLYQSTQSWRST